MVAMLVWRGSCVRVFWGAFPIIGVRRAIVVAFKVWQGRPWAEIEFLALYIMQNRFRFQA